MSVTQEGYPKDWAKVVLMVSPKGEIHAIDGDRGPGDPRADLPYIGLERIKAKFEPKYPWWRKDRYGWPIETFKDKPFKSALRIICQNIRKITH